MDGYSNPLTQLQSIIEGRFPAARYEFDPAQAPTGSSFLDIYDGEYNLNIEWRPERCFGIVAGREILYGEGADELYYDLDAVAERVAWLLENRATTSAPNSVVILSGLINETPNVAATNK